MGQLQNLKLTKGSSIEEYLLKAWKLKNQLSSMGEHVSDRNLNQIVLNGILCLFESTIQTLTHLDLIMSFETLNTSLLSEAHQRQHRTKTLEDEEALAASF